MASPVDGKEFLDLVRRSEVADSGRLEAFLQQQRGDLPREPSRIADMLIAAGLLTAFQADAILQGKWKRFTIGKYRILDKLGAGGMAIVYLCEHVLMRRRVAVKVLPTAKAADANSLQRFYREARAVAALDHPNIVHAYDIDHDDSLHFLVMEYVEGLDLQEMVKKEGPLDVASVCHYMRQSALGLDHARQRGLVHRDIKPSNILVNGNGQVKILDMGLARFFRDDEAILTNKYDERVLGTADYLAPEQAEDSHEVDIRADIYSLGATFYFLLTGKTMFGEGTVSQKLMWHQHNQPRPVTELRSDVPAGLAAILAKMVAKSPAQRYQVPAEIAEVLTPYVPAAMLARLTEKDTAAVAAAALHAVPQLAAKPEPASIPVARLIQPSPPPPSVPVQPAAVPAAVPAVAPAANDHTRSVLFAMLGAGIVLLVVLCAIVIKLAFFPSAPTARSQESGIRSHEPGVGPGARSS